jgi:hypothetical protein
MEIVYKIRSAIYVIAILAVITAQCMAFWPADMIPHPHVPQPTAPNPGGDLANN